MGFELRFFYGVVGSSIVWVLSCGSWCGSWCGSLGGLGVEV